jgi:WD40 repeat protein
LEEDVIDVVTEAVVRFEQDATPEVVFCQPIKRLKPSSTSLRVLERSFGGLSTQGRGFRADPCIASDSYATRDFVSSERDIHSHRRRALAFSVAACNTNSLAAIAIETGRLHIVDTAEGSSFEKCHIMIKALENAITDVVFSSDDMTLALACGDKSMRLIDMQTQKTKMIFENHLGCVKQVRYRPGDEHVLATSCREGIVNLWDTRCKGETRPIMTQFVQGDTRYGSKSVDQEYKVEVQTNPMRSWPGAHADRLRGIKTHDKNAFR